jgi:hypothetical protein
MKQADIEIVANAIGFFVSVIKSGEEWTKQCNEIKAQSQDALFRLSEKAGNGAND